MYNENSIYMKKKKISAKYRNKKTTSTNKRGRKRRNSKE